MTSRLFICCFAVGLSFASCLTAQDELTQLKYNHPGLTVDLGVGLWAWPLPCDADQDGDYDLIVSCPDKPSNGIYLFENTDGDTAQHKLPTFKPGRRLSKTVHYVMPSYVGDSMRVLSPGVEYTDFLKSGTETKVDLPIKAKFYTPPGTQPKGPKMRHNQWRYVDFDGDGKLDLSLGLKTGVSMDGTMPGMRTANGPTGRFMDLSFGSAILVRPTNLSMQNPKRFWPTINRSICLVARHRTLSTLTMMVISIYSAVSFSIALRTSRMSVPEQIQSTLKVYD